MQRDLKNDNQHQSVKNMTRGGQIILHNLRMLSQIMNKVLLWTLPIALLVMVCTFFITTDSYHRYIGKKWVVAEFYSFIGSDHHQQEFRMEDGSINNVNVIQ